MEGIDSALALGPEALKVDSSPGHPAGTLSEPSSEAPGDQESSAIYSKRDLASALEVEDEESEGPLRERDLKAANVQLIQGTQEWQDGCTYRGEFGLHTKLGFGEFSWPTGETYCGHFYRDHCHGLGTYTWPDGSNFTGTFYLSHREGYGTMQLRSRLFQGLYKADKRFGPGVETYPDGSQDVGLWFHQHLIKLCWETPGSFSLLNYPELAHFLKPSPARLSLSDDEAMGWGLDEDLDPFFYEYEQFLLNDDLTLPPDMHIYSTDNGHLPMTYSFRKALDAQLFADEVPPFVKEEEPWFVTNETPLMVRIQKQTYKFRNKTAYTSWHMDAIVRGDRSNFARCGPREQLAKEMILKAEDGDYDWIHKVLRDNLVSADVADARGYTVLAAAAVHCHRRVINLLLDSGADVNKCSDEGLTPLGICFLLYYPAEAFKPNIAERTMLGQQEAMATAPGLSSFFLTAEDTTESLYADGSIHLSQSHRHQKLLGPSGENDGALQKLLQLSWESADLRSMSQRLSSTQDRSSNSELLQGTDDTLGNTARGTQCSNDTTFDSNLSVRSLSIDLSPGLLECSAQAYTLLKTTGLGARGSEKGTLNTRGSDKGTMQKMALSMIEHRNRWQTIQLLLRRGADPNLCSVPMQVLFLAVKTADVDAVKLLLENGARTDIQLPLQLWSLTPLHIAAALPGEDGVRITELLLHAITDVDAQAADQDEVYLPRKVDLLSSSSLKLNNEPGPPTIYYSQREPAPEGGRTALHVACEREDDNKCSRDIVRLLLAHKANPNTLWSGHSPLSLSIVSGNDLIVKELLSHGADPNLLLTKGLGNALCMACDLTYEHHRSMDSKLFLIDQLISYGADILNPVTITQGDKVAVGTAVDYGYFKFFQDRKIAHSPFHSLLPAERETLLARKRLLEHMAFQLRRAVFAKESQWDQKLLYLSKRAELAPHRMKKTSSTSSKCLGLEESEIPFFRFCCHCGRSIGVRLSPCARCYSVLTCSKFCKTRAWNEFHKRDCGATLVMIPKDL